MRIAILAAALVCATTAHAACSDDAATLAQKYGITASLASDAPSSAAAKTEALAKSGGVIAPPATGDMAAVTPAVPNPEPMQTAPAIAPQAALGNAAKPSGAATDSQAASLLQAAREAGVKGDESVCVKSLAEAKALLKKRSL